MRAWRTRMERYGLTGVQCPRCRKLFATPRLICSVCRSELWPVAAQVFPRLNSPSGDGYIEASVVIPAYNAAATILGTLDSLKNQDCSVPFEVIVVDSSADRTDHLVASRFPWVRLIHCPQQTDPGTARNLAIAQARGTIIACLDADCLASPDWLRLMLAAHQAGYQVVGGAVQNGNDQSLTAWAGYIAEFREFLPAGSPRPVVHVPTCNISYHRSIFDRFGGFPTRYYPQEDLLYHWWLCHFGISIWFDPSIQVRHLHRSVLRDFVSHQRRIGAATARVLALTGREGAFLARAPILALLAAPILPLVKFARTITHLLTCQPGLLQHHWPALLVLLLGLYAWGLGFANGTWKTPPQLATPEVLPELP